MPNSAQKIQWIDPNGQRLTLEVLSDGELHINVEHGAATIRAKNCILTEFSLPVGTPETRKHVPYFHITIAGLSFRVDWK